MISNNKITDKNTNLLNSLSGFTLIELLVVISILGLLSTVVLNSLNSAREKAKIAKAKSEVKTLYEVLHRYNLYNQDWPTADNINTVAGWNAAWSEPYISQVNADPWGNPYFFDGRPDTECAAGGSAVCSGGPNGSISSFNRADMTPQGDDVCIYFPPSC